MAVKLKSRVKRKGDSKSFIKNLGKELGNAPEVVVGVPSDAIPYPDGTSVSMVAAVHEFGTSTIPERSFLRTAVDENLPKYIRMSEKGVKRVIEGKLDILQLAELLGTEAQGDVQEKIVSISTPALKEATIKKKGSSNPLVDTGHLRQSIRYEVREN